MDTDIERRKFVVGLGNPGRRYARNRHNVGWMVLASLRARWKVANGRNAFGGEIADVVTVGPDGIQRRVELFVPHLYMNRSGEAVKGLVDFYKSDHRSILVVLDDLALPLGRIRVRASGSAGGHNGLNDILRLLASQDIPRVRIGIGSPPPEMDSSDYVLANFGKDEVEVVASAIQAAADAVEDWIHRDIYYVMQKYNRNPDA